MTAKTLDYQCGGGISVEQYVIELPKGVEILAWPKDAKLSAKHAIYRSQYRVKGRTVTVTRELEDRAEGSVCSPEDFSDFKTFAATVRKDLRTQVVYR